MMTKPSAGRVLILGRALADEAGLDSCLGQLGYDVVAVVDDVEDVGGRAADADLVLLDIDLVEAEGETRVSHRLRIEHNLPVVVVARRDGEAAGDSSAGEESCGCVHFPFEGRELQSVLQSAMIRHQVAGERRRLERQMIALQKSESLGVMSRHLVHDFNNRLHAVLGYIQFAALDLPKGGAAAKMLEQAVESGMKGSALCREFLVYSTPQTQCPPVAELSTVVHECQPLLRTIVKKGVVIDCKLAVDLPHLDISPSEVRQILFNLALNASDAIGSRRGVLTLTTGHLWLRAAELGAMAGAPVRSEGEYAFLELEDDGVGIHSEVAGRMFEPFFTTKFSGSGLGLTAVRDLVNLHQGAIQVRVKEGGGAALRVYLPVPRTQAHT